MRVNEREQANERQNKKQHNVAVETEQSHNEYKLLAPSLNKCRILVKYKDIFDKIYHYMLDIIIAVQFIKSQYTETQKYRTHGKCYNQMEKQQSINIEIFQT